MTMLRSSVVVVTVVATMALLLSSAMAVDFNTKCKTMGAADMVGDYFPILEGNAPGAPMCYYFVNSGATANPPTTMEYTHAMAATGYDYELIVWNIDQVPGFFCSISGVQSGFFTRTDGLVDATTIDIVSYQRSLTSNLLQTGSSVATNFSCTGNMGIAIAPRYGATNSPPLPPVNRDNPLTFKISPSLTTFTLDITEPFTTQERAAKWVDVTLTTEEIPAAATPDSRLMGARLRSDGSGTTAPAEGTQTAGRIVMKFRDFGLASPGIEKGKVTAQVSLLRQSDEFVNWKEAGPWRTGTIAVMSEMLPTLTSTWQQFDIEDKVAYAVLGKGTWWQSATVYHFFGGDSAPTGAGYTYADPSIQSAKSSSKGQAISFSSIAGPVVNSDLIGSPSAGSPVGIYKQLTGGTRRATYRYVKAQQVTWATAKADSKPTTVWLRAVYKELTGECFSNADCNPGKGDDTVAGHVLSANGDRARMRTCMMLPSPFDFNTYASRCIECMSSEDCRAGQYCHMDVGLCSSHGTIFTCDSTSNALAGICREKDPSGIIIGKPCSSAQVHTFTTSNQFTSMITVSEGASANAITGSGLCGEALYYNASYAPNEESAVDSAGTARATLWIGKCLSGTCYECNPDSSVAPFSAVGKEGVQCVNGREVERRDVDFTIRTLTSNTIAGILVTAVIGILLILICLCLNAHQTMSKGETHRKSLHQKYEDEQLVRAKSGRV